MSRLASRVRFGAQGIGALVIALASSVYLALARDYRTGTLAAPGAGAFPRAIGGALLALSLALATVDALRARPGVRSPPADEAPARGGRRVLMFAVVALLYPILMRQVGFETATAVELVLLAVVMGERRPGPLALFALLGAATGRLLFRRWLGVPLP